MRARSGLDLANRSSKKALTTWLQRGIVASISHTVHVHGLDIDRLGAKKEPRPKAGEKQRNVTAEVEPGRTPGIHESSGRIPGFMVSPLEGLSA
jgi:hypothetical protein